MSNAEMLAISRLPRAMATGSVPCLNRLALRLICTSNWPGADRSSCSFNTFHMRACQSSGTAGVEMRSSCLLWARAGWVLAPKARATPSRVRREKAVLARAVMGRVLKALR